MHMPAVTASSLIPHGGGAVTILVISILFAMLCATIAVEMRRNHILWLVISFVGSFVIISAVHAVI